MLILLKLFQKVAKKGKLPKSFYEATITLIQKLDKNATKKKKKKKNQERERERGNYTPVSLMNINAKILKKILTICVQQYIKKIIHLDQVRFIPGMQGFFNIYKSAN